MARIAGVDIPNKRIEVALTYIYGIGRPTAVKIAKTLGLDVNKKTNDLQEADIIKLREYIESELAVEGERRDKLRNAIQRLMSINCYRGMRHRRGLPVRGQRTSTNARTRKGRGKTIANKKIAKK